MAYFTLCIHCEMGEHNKHTEVITPPPIGGVGGVMCHCPGGCVYDEPEWITEFKEFMAESRSKKALIEACSPSGCRCSCHQAGALNVAHVAPCCTGGDQTIRDGLS